MKLTDTLTVTCNMLQITELKQSYRISYQLFLFCLFLSFTGISAFVFLVQEAETYNILENENTGKLLYSTNVCLHFLLYICLQT